MSINNSLRTILTIAKIMRNADLLSASGTDVTITCESLDDREELFDILESFATRPDVDAAVLEAQRQSFAYGNTKLHNPDITREIITQETEGLKGLNKCTTCGTVLSHEFASCKCGPSGPPG